MSAAQELEICVGSDGLTGYCYQNGNVVIEQKFWDGLPFIDGHAAVRVEDKWGIINSSGVWMVEPRYDEVFNCENVFGTILVLEEGKWFFCNEYGIPLSREYEVASPWYEFELDGYHARFTENTWFSVIRKGKWGVVDINDEVKLPFEYEFTRVLKQNVDGQEKPVSVILKKKGKYAWQRLDAKAATAFEFDTFLGQYIDLLFFRSGSSTSIINSVTGERLERGGKNFYTLVNAKDSVGLVNATGDIIVPFRYQTVNLNKVKNHVVFGQFGQLGLSDLRGNKLLDPIYRDINDLGTTPSSV
ncbi:MAG: WG repeat-containing protein, partial [Flavobacteriales bacterium]|nr:WG repeat-containing protein [Flavobacteriales bacterium]